LTRAARRARSSRVELPSEERISNFVHDIGDDFSRIVGEESVRVCVAVGLLVDELGTDWNLRPAEINEGRNRGGVDNLAETSPANSSFAHGARLTGSVEINLLPISTIKSTCLAVGVGDDLANSVDFTVARRIVDVTGTVGHNGVGSAVDSKGNERREGARSLTIKR